MHSLSPGWRHFHRSVSAVPMWKDQQTMSPDLFHLLGFFPSVCSPDLQEVSHCQIWVWMEYIAFMFSVETRTYSPSQHNTFPVFHFGIRACICWSNWAVLSKIQCVLVGGMLLVSFNNFEISKSLFNLFWGDVVLPFCFMTTFLKLLLDLFIII